MKLEQVTDGELSILQVLWDRGDATSRQIATVVYDDVDTSLHNMAKLSLSAHLIKLQRENRALHHPDESWEMLSI